MAIRPRLELRQTQRLAMTPELRQAIQMLQMSSIELAEFLRDQVEANPLLSMEASAAAPAAPERPAVATVDAEMARGDPAAGAEALGAAPENLWESAGPAPSRDGAADALEFRAQPLGLADHVRRQLPLADLDGAARRCADLLCFELDDDGYLRVDDADAAEWLGTTGDVVARARAAIQSCEPTGVGARDLAECLALQLDERGELDRGMRALLGLLDRLPRTPAADLAARCELTEEELARRVARLRRLDPRPGLGVSDSSSDPAAPDVVVRADGRGKWLVELNPHAMPRLLVDRRYAARIGAEEDDEARAFLAQCAKTAHWLRRGLDQRARTMLAVSAEIVRRQDGFLAQGPAGLRPMTLKDVAEALGVHESTVSRVVANKTMAAPRGVVELRAFFTASLGTGDEACSAGAVRERIRLLVAGEPPAKPLSDDQIVRILGEEGVDVARRTVAKYRDALGIPSSVARRRRAAAALC